MYRVPSDIDLEDELDFDDEDHEGVIACLSTSNSPSHVMLAGMAEVEASGGKGVNTTAASSDDPAPPVSPPNKALTSPPAPTSTVHAAISTPLLVTTDTSSLTDFHLESAIKANEILQRHYEAAKVKIMSKKGAVESKVESELRLSMLRKSSENVKIAHARAEREQGASDRVVEAIRSASSAAPDGSSEYKAENSPWRLVWESLKHAESDTACATNDTHFVNSLMHKAVDLGIKEQDLVKWQNDVIVKYLASVLRGSYDMSVDIHTGYVGGMHSFGSIMSLFLNVFNRIYKESNDAKVVNSWGDIDTKSTIGVSSIDGSTAAGSHHNIRVVISTPEEVSRFDERKAIVSNASDVVLDFQENMLHVLSWRYPPLKKDENKHWKTVLALVEALIWRGLHTTISNLYYSLYSLDDSEVYQEIQSLKTRLRAEDIGVNAKYIYGDDDACDTAYQQPIALLRSLADITCPRDKIMALVQTKKTIEESISRQQALAPPISNKLTVIGADDLLPLFTFVLIRSNPRQLVSQVNMMEKFLPMYMSSGEEGYCFCSLLVSMEFVRDQYASLRTKHTAGATDTADTADTVG